MKVFDSMIYLGHFHVANAAMAFTSVSICDFSTHRGDRILNNKIYNFVKHHLPFYRLKLMRLRQIQEKQIAIREEQESTWMTRVFHDSKIVRNGPFLGMEYIGQAKCSQLLPKILGSYEEPLHEWIEDAIKSNRYSEIYDIGCAEGYYAVGLARALPNIDIHAFDIDADAIHLAKRLAELNGVCNIHFHGEFTCEIQSTIKPNTLIFCDIEGNENSVLDPGLTPELLNADYVIECHDCFVPGTSQQIIERFSGTHIIERRYDYPSRIKKYTVDGEELDSKIVVEIGNECRPPYMSWLHMKRIMK